MKIGIMQPYFFPYIGYWQLLNYVDQYVIFDNVNYIKRGWINRNRILINGKESYFGISISGASQNKLINEIYISTDESFSKKIKTLELAYRKASYFSENFDIVEKIILCEETNLSRYLRNQIEVLADYLGINTKILVASEMEFQSKKKAQEKILDICSFLGASDYCNPIGGKLLYDKERFSNAGVELHFIKARDIVYNQNMNDFVSNLSIIDVLMFNSKETVTHYLKLFDIE